jgi:hypothetical protein
MSHASAHFALIISERVFFLSRLAWTMILLFYASLHWRGGRHMPVHLANGFICESHELFTHADLKLPSSWSQPQNSVFPVSRIIDMSHWCHMVLLFFFGTGFAM